MCEAWSCDQCRSSALRTLPLGSRVHGLGGSANSPPATLDVELDGASLEADTGSGSCHTSSCACRTPYPCRSLGSQDEKREGVLRRGTLRQERETVLDVSPQLLASRTLLAYL